MMRRALDDARVLTERAALRLTDIASPPRNVRPATFRALGVARVRPPRAPPKEISPLRLGPDGRETGCPAARKAIEKIPWILLEVFENELGSGTPIRAR